MKLTIKELYDYKSILEINEELDYVEAPFNPSENYPEINFLKNIKLEKKPNFIYSTFRQMLFNLKLDMHNYGKKSWNPFSAFISKGDCVVIKPNLVMHEIDKYKNQHCIYTDFGLIRPLIDYTIKALDNSGEIIIADSPVQGADFNILCQQSGINDLINYYKENGFEIKIFDLRKEWAVLSKDGTQIMRKEKLAGDPNGYAELEIGEMSFLSEILNEDVKLSITGYNDDETNIHHTKKKNEYLISNTILNSQVIINVPKLKTHQKSGITCAMKNMIGINGAKDYLAHHRSGSVEEGGDEYPEKTWFNTLFRNVKDKLNNKYPHWVWNITRKSGLIIKSILEKTSKEGINPHIIGAGGWYGNDTIWRTIYDINKILYFYDINNKCFKNEPVRKTFILVDGIISGEGDGPLSPESKKCGIMLAGFNPFYIDLIAAKIMGFDYKKISFLKNLSKLIENIDFSLKEKILFNSEKARNIFTDNQFSFKPPKGWINNIK